jgi:hypothetical protein
MACPKCGKETCRYRGFLYEERKETIGMWDCDEELLQTIREHDSIIELLNYVPDIMRVIAGTQTVSTEHWEELTNIQLRLTAIYKKVRKDVSCLPTTAWPGPYDMGIKEGEESD